MVDRPYPWHFWNHLLEFPVEGFNLPRPVGLPMLTDWLPVERTEFQQCLDPIFGICASRSRVSVGYTSPLLLKMAGIT